MQIWGQYLLTFNLHQSSLWSRSLCPNLAPSDQATWELLSQPSFLKFAIMMKLVPSRCKNKGFFSKYNNTSLDRLKIYAHRLRGLWGYRRNAGYGMTIGKRAVPTHLIIWGFRQASTRSVEASHTTTTRSLLQPWFRRGLPKITSTLTLWHRVWLVWTGQAR